MRLLFYLIFSLLLMNKDNLKTKWNLMVRNLKCAIHIHNRKYSIGYNNKNPTTSMFYAAGTFF